MKTSVLLFLIAAGFSAHTVANNGMETVEFELEVPMDTVFLECLNEYIAGPFWVTAKGHRVETPSGNVHILDNWHYTTVFTGQSTGRVWVNRGVSPLHQNIVKNGEVFGLTDSSLARPLDEGPKWRGNYNFKLRIDAEGNAAVTVEVSNVRCIGPKKKS